MTRAELRELVSQWVDDTENGYFTTATVNTFLNNALYEVQKRLILAGENFYIKCVTTPSVADQQEYELPNDFWGVRRLRIITGGSGPTATKVELTPVSLGQEIMFSKIGMPQGYYLKKDRLVLVPTPNSSNWTIEMDYAYQIGMMTQDTDEPDVPTHFQEYIAILAAYNCFIKDDRVPSILERKKEQYEKMLDESSEARVMAKARTVIVTPEGFFGNF